VSDVPETLLGDRPPAAPGPTPAGRGIPMPRWLDRDAPTRRLLARLFWPGTAAVALMLAGGLWRAGLEPQAISVLGMLALTVGLFGGVALLRAAFSGSHPVGGVARTIIEEAIGTRLSVLLAVLVIVSLPTLPLLLDPSERLAYRIQFFLAWSLSGATVLLAILSIALGCSSVCGDIDSKRIHMALSKPLQRWEYVGGKWLGIVALQGMLVALVGIGVYGFTTALARLPAADDLDRLAVDEQVLTARAACRPVHPSGDDFMKTVAATIEQIRKDDPATFDIDPEGARQRILSHKIHEWHTVTADAVSTYVFTGLDPKRIRARVVQLRLEPLTLNSSISDAQVKLAIWLNDRAYPFRNGRHEEYTLSTDMVHTIDVPTSVIAADGTLRLTIENKNLVMPTETHPTTIQFIPGEGMEVLYRVDGFAWNFVRGLAVMWAKLALIAAGAVAAAAWLGFPTALLASLMIYVTATARAFFADAIDIYTGVDGPQGTLTGMLRLRAGMLADRLLKFEWWDAAKTVGSFVADGFLCLVPSFGAYDSVTQLATGRVVPAAEVWVAVAVLACGYPLLLLVAGWLLLERRDLVGSLS
jgi:hypothetical protein